MPRPARRSVQSNGYVKIGSQYEHRLVLHHVIGDGPHLCAECRTPVNWSQPSHPLEVDHVDWDRTNNDPANLRALCRRCNNRGRQKLSDYGWLLDPDR